ncbi:MAG: 1-acyl-sn-glycerol-3-phosphate acyltransferase [Planctomycetes bacterium]|nr:1-acyl-sn-glycerol-3-phosphate acyltransferase [Planctomycetota bacterium]
MRKVIRKLNKFWRIIATGISFSVFGIGGLLGSVSVIPFLYLFSWSQETRARRTKLIIHYAFRMFIEMMRILGMLTYSVQDRELLNKPGRLILANHPSLIDVVFLMAFIKRADCIVKSSLLQNPFMRLPINTAGYIANDDPERVIELAAASLARGNSLIVFPEGTRTTPGEPLLMKRGAANVALRTDHDVSPVIIRCDPPAFTKGIQWYEVPEIRFHYSMCVQSNVKIDEFQQASTPSMAARRLTQFLEQYFTKGLLAHE